MDFLFFWQNTQLLDSVSEFTLLPSVQNWGAQGARPLAAPCSSPSRKVVCTQWRRKEYAALPPHLDMSHNLRDGCCGSSLETPM